VQRCQKRRATLLGIMAAHPMSLLASRHSAGPEAGTAQRPRGRVDDFDSPLPGNIARCNRGGGRPSKLRQRSGPLGVHSTGSANWASSPR